ncbi:hypothetical protein PR202_ga02552 [Eleusine coracana subsp. coracana]|uniref:E2 ubiquitin-conjugating enzyme n=1 Tax=Eleusine coracana subsp. coracana TaxID=191504 RepID=A0AAV5BJS6_ELECO|nr:hypothetical protein QOZ80_2AG0143750 [Eleusine coracana subsp. coracana]GJM86671.1 hypothetical protein PR202_ga02552 [Eleusine coracana subsp. coracana]
MGAAPSKAEPNWRRIRKELHQMWVDPPPFCRPGPAPVTELLHWEVVIDGPEDSPYAGGTFTLDVQFPWEHPYKPPRVTFKTKIYHPNINSEGQMVLDIFKENWSPALTIDRLLLSIVSVLYDPMLDYPVNRRMAHLYQTNIKLYEKKARAWTRMYASAPVVSYYPEKGDEQWQEYCDAFTAYNEEMEEMRKWQEKDRLQAAVSSTGHTARRARGLNIVWRRTVAFLQGRSVTVPSTAKKAA